MGSFRLILAIGNRNYANEVRMSGLIKHQGF